MALSILLASNKYTREQGEVKKIKTIKSTPGSVAVQCSKKTLLVDVTMVVKLLMTIQIYNKSTN